MQGYGDISEGTANRIDRVMLGLAECESIEELEGRFLAEAGKLLPADCLCWNNWRPDWSGVISFRTNDGYADWLTGRLELFGQVVGHHPVIAAGHFQRSAEEVLRMSDFQSAASFRDNPLYRDIYRHLDSHFQVCFTASSLSDRKILLTWNRRALDFSERDRQIFHFMGLRLGMVSRRVEERQRLDRAWQVLCGLVDSRLHTNTVRSLGARDAGLLAKLMKGRTVGVIARESGIRRDSVDKQLGVIRERLGLENHRQLLSALAELKRSRGMDR
ncbi:hypothetical protein OKA05_18175 [Luteolibacter arcticus]|uniref:HTH luxR-type domain-containing protein n=1 Tax=Luteolibacter arcticus TaxID=1581411 RepID=A0ABT3GLU7_9BACT|nr:hypothetical protein [Luteolibacter arcticus]MCW1924499.1 hypothetical protein [Luteolibacter arcticus]